MPGGRVARFLGGRLMIKWAIDCVLSIMLQDTKAKTGMWHHQLFQRTAFILALVLSGCGGDSDIQIIETKVESESFIEPIRINNCGGKADSEQTVQRSFATSIEGTTGLKVGYEIVAGSVSAKYGQYKNTIKSQRLVAPAGTNMEFILKWFEQVSEGSITANGRVGSYKVQVPVSVEQISSRDLGCKLGPPIQFATPVQQITHEVSAKEKWQDTGITVSTGDVVTVEYVVGMWTGGTGANRWYDARGDLVLKYRCIEHADNLSSCEEPMPDAYNGALIGKVEDSLIEIGNYAQFTSSTSGNLFLRMNDKDKGLFDNEGTITVRITIQH